MLKHHALFVTVAAAAVLWALLPWYFYFHDQFNGHADPAVLLALGSLLPMLAGSAFDPHLQVERFPLDWIAMSSAFNLVMGFIVAYLVHKSSRKSKNGDARAQI
jgi:hypothetical protein